MNAKIGDHDVLESGTLVGQKDSIFTIILGTNSLAFKIIFQDKEGGEQVINFNVSPDKKGLDTTLVNFNNPLGTGNGEAIQVGTFGENPERELFFNFAVYAIGNASKVLHYSFLLGNIIK